MSVCSKCGNVLDDGVKFCKYCGNPVAAENKEAVLNPEVQPDHGGKSKKRPGVVAIVSGIALIVVAVGIFLAIRSRDEYVMTSYTIYDAEGNVTFYSEEYYDDNWLATGFWAVYDDGSTREAEYEYTFYEDGKTPKEMTYVSVSDNYECTYVYYYDEDGDLLEHEACYDFGSTYTYDADGRLVKYENSDYSYEIVYEYQFDDDGNVAKRTENRTDADGSVTVTVKEYEYDDGEVTRMEETEYTDTGEGETEETVGWSEYIYVGGDLIQWSSDDMTGESEYFYLEDDGDIYGSSSEHNHADEILIGWYTLNSDGTVSQEVSDGYALKWTGDSAWIYSDDSMVFENYYEEEYDTHGNCIKKSSYNSDGELLGWYEYEWQKTD